MCTLFTCKLKHKNYGSVKARRCVCAKHKILTRYVLVQSITPFQKKIRRQKKISLGRRAQSAHLYHTRDIAGCTPVSNGWTSKTRQHDFMFMVLLYAVRHHGYISYTVCVSRLHPRQSPREASRQGKRTGPKKEEIANKNNTSVTRKHDKEMKVKRPKKKKNARIE